VKGTLGLDDVEVQHADGRPAIKLAAVRVGIDKLAPWAASWPLARVLDKPDLSVSRGRDGQLSLLALIPKRAPLPSDKQAAPAAPSSNTKPFALSLAEFKLTGGRVHITDELPASPYQKTLQDLHVSLRQLRLPGASRPRWISASNRVG
jgi:hypothetical protein